MTSTTSRAGRAGVPVRQQPSCVVFDMDGVLVDTARIHEEAWKVMFDEFLRHRGDEDLFETDDYRRHVDGRPRYRGVAAFLESRGIELPPGEPTDPPGMESEAALGNRKNQILLERLEETQVRPLAGVEELLTALRDQAVPLAVVSSSRNTERILPDEVRRRVDVVLGGTDLDELEIPGKPQPDMFIEAAGDLGFGPELTTIVEDSMAGVVAGRRGGFALVVGVDDRDDSPSMVELADVVVAGVSELPSSITRWSGLLKTPPSALEHVDTIRHRLEDDGIRIYVGDDEGELLSVRKADGVGVVVDPQPSSMTWADYAVPDQRARRDLLASLDLAQVDD